MSVLIIFFFLTLMLIIYLTYWIKKWRNPKCIGVLPPGSMGLPIIGESLQLLIPNYSLDLHPFIKRRINRYGPIFRSNVAGHPIVFSADSEFNHYVVNQERRLVEFWYLDTYSKLFVLEGESSTSGATAYIHKYIRSLFLNHFGNEKLKENFLPQIQDVVNKILHSWSSQEFTEVKRSASSEFQAFTAKFLLGYDAEKSSYKMGESFAKFLETLLAFPLNIPGTPYRQSLEVKKKIMNTLENLLKERSNSTEETNEEDVLDHMLKDMEKEKFITKDFIIQVLFGSLFAVSESVPVIIALLFKFLSENPSVVEELMAEHEKILKSNGSDSPITWDQYKSMKFTSHVIQETLRISNVTPGVMRRAIRDIQYKGYTIPAGWTIMLLASACHMNSETFKDPLVFNPWRWNDLDSKCISKNFTPYGGGTRQCAGAEYSKVFLSIFLHVLVTKYRWTYIKEGKLCRRPMLLFGDGIHIKLHEKN
ncbi:beta-amyrin 16-alpha-hydroxylase CYP87D16-like isoform X1 [Mercurialis annua]|uniref:beta-amyrin 16-alpha-hydroxylase CYP87D16-like isoform X1 n=1 Tax=Mercurialis annua TaxID=3986 RepID=UPI00215F31A7|nr:beta-amyrin 16-alpha-hydroxylase CYP87D16-like isoform X1 [Mercurialis annua]